jgi:sRNA-binding regulator protein Hfq
MERTGNVTANAKNQNNEFGKKLIDRWGKYTIYLVNDEKIRNTAEYAEEFSDYGVNIGKKGLSTLNFKFIPKNEIWIARSIRSSERHFIISNALAYIKGIERGVDPGDSYDKALDKEKSERTKDATNKLHIKNNKSAANPLHKDIPKKVYSKEYGVINDSKEKVNIFLINGGVVRDLYKTDYVEGGHAYVYDWIPEDEIWIEKTVKQDEIPVIILHEFLERTLMKYKKFPYVRAHVAASKVEFEHRGIFNKKDALSLTRSIVINKLLRNINY